ncbi:hypothetical protein IJ579_03105 [bacterium]|nr:hypothetical protein [bacterium]
MDKKQLNKRIYIFIILIVLIGIFLPILKNIINSYNFQKTQTSKSFFDDKDLKVPYEDREVPDYKNLKIVKVVEGLALDSNGHVWEKHKNAKGLYPVWKKDGSLLSEIIDIESNGINFYALSDDHTVWAWGSDMFGLVPVAKEFRNTSSEYREIEYPKKIVFKDGRTIQRVKKISASIDVCYLIMQDDTVYAFGSNEGNLQFLGLPSKWTADGSDFDGLGNLKELMSSYSYSPVSAIDVSPYPQKMPNISCIKDIFCYKTSNARSIYFLLNDGTSFIKGKDEKYCDFKKFLPEKILMTSNCDVSVALLSDKTALSWYCIPENFSKRETNAYLFLGHKKNGNVNIPARVRNNETGEIIQNIDAISSYNTGLMILKNGQIWRQGSGPQNNGTDWIKKSSEKEIEHTPCLFHQKYSNGTPVDDAKGIFSDYESLYFISNAGILYAWGDASWLIEKAKDNKKDCYFPRKVTFHPYYDKEKNEWISFTQE